MECWTLGSFHFTCATLKRLSLRRCTSSFIDICHPNQVLAKPEIHQSLLQAHAHGALGQEK
ncbi:hypothetical protein OROHE_016269 [Orobanche hederae]